MSSNVDKNVENSAPDRSFGQVLSDIGSNMLQGYARNGGRGALAGAVMGAAGIETPWEKDDRRSDMQLKLLEQSYQNNAQNFKNNQEMFALQKEGQQQINKSRGMQLAEAEEIHFRNQIQDKKQKNLEQLYNSLGVPLNSMGRTVFDQNPAVQAYVELGTVLQLADDNPDMAKRLMQNMGYTARMDGDKIAGFEKGGQYLPYSPETLQAIGNKITPQLRTGLKAAFVLGTEATSMDQVSTKNMLMNDKFKNIYRTADGKVDYGLGLGDYEQYLQNGNFTPLQKSSHVLSRTIQSAMVDGILSQKEIQGLLPQFQAAMQDLGCEVMSPDGSIGNAKVKLGNGTEMSLIKFADGLKERDVIASSWNAELDRKAAMKEQAALKMAKEMEDLRYKRGLANAKEQEVRGVIGGAAEDVSEWDENSKALWQEGQKAIKNFNIKTPEIKGKSKADVTLDLGIAYNQAENEYVISGDFKKAQSKFKDELKANEWKDSQIPDLWGAAGDEQELAMLEKRNSYLRDVMNKQRQSGTFKSEMVTTADLPEATEVDQAIPRGMRIENKEAAEYKRNIDRIGELRKKAYLRTQNKKQASEYLKKRPSAGKRLVEAAQKNR